MTAIKTARELIHEDNSSLTFYRVGKIYHKRNIGTKTNCYKPRKRNNAEKTQKRKFKVPYARKNEDTKIPFEKVTLSSANLANTMEQKNTLLEKSEVVSNEEKLSANTSIKEYNYT